MRKRKRLSYTQRKLPNKFWKSIAQFLYSKSVGKSLKESFQMHYLVFYLKTTLRIFASINYSSSLTKFINHLMMDLKHKVRHKGVIFQLPQSAISGNLLDFLLIFLSDRKQRVALKRKTSARGFSEGSILRPLLFLIYIHDLSGDLSSKAKLLMIIHRYFLYQMT